MSLMPKRVKYRKMQRGSMGGVATRGSSLAFGDYALKAIDRGYLSAIQIEAARVALSRHVKRSGKLWLRAFPGQALYKKAARNTYGKR